MLQGLVLWELVLEGQSDSVPGIGSMGMVLHDGDAGIGSVEMVLQGLVLSGWCCRDWFCRDGAAGIGSVGMVLQGLVLYAVRVSLICIFC